MQLGVGPGFHFVTGAVQDDQIVHGGLKIYLAAVIDQALIKRNMSRVPPEWRARAAEMTEVRFSPWYMPDTLFLSPKVDDTQMWGIKFRPLAIGFSLGPRPVRFSVSAGLILTYAYIGSDDPDIGHTHFLRPGIDVRAELEIPITDVFLISFGWTSGFYVPQELNAGVFEASSELDRNLWHFGQAFLMFHGRFPMEHSL